MNRKKLETALAETTDELERYIHNTRVLWDLHRAVVETAIEKIENGDTGDLLDMLRETLADIDDIDNKEASYAIAEHIGWGAS